MKALKKIALVGAALVALLAILLALALVPAIQTWAVRKAVASQPGLKLEVARVAAGFSSADLREVRLVKDGTIVTARRVNAKYSAWDFLTHKRITVHDAVVEDLVIDARAAATAAGPAREDAASPKSAGRTGTADTPSKPFSGVLNQAQLPYDLRVARFHVPGRALLPNDQVVTFDVRGSDITTGRRGTIDWKVDFANPQPDSPVRALHSSGTAAVHVTTEKRIDLVDVNAEISAEGPKLPTDRIKLEAKIEQPAAGGNEGYNAQVSLLRGSSVEQLLTLAGQFDAASGQVAGAWKIDVHSEQLAAILAGLGMPDAAISGAGKFTAKPDANAVTATGDLQSDLSHLEKISPELASIGSMRLLTRFDGGFTGDTAHLSQFTLDATTSSGHKLTHINALQRVSFSLKTKLVSFADPAADLARISIQALPLAWAQPFAKGITIDDGELSMVLAIAAEADGSRVRLSTVEPLTVRSATLTSEGRKLANRLSVSVKPQAEYASDRLHAELRELSLTTPEGDRVGGIVAIDIAPLSGTRVITFSSETQTNLVAALKPYLALDTGPLTIRSRSEGTFSGKRLEITRSSTEVTRSSGPMLSSFELLQPLTVDLNAVVPSVPNPEAEAVRLTLGTVPLSWVEAFVAGSKFSGELTGATLVARIRGNDHFEAATTAPITVRRASASINGKPMVRNVDMAVDFSAAKQGSAIRYNVRKLEAREGAATLVTLTAAGDAVLGDKIALTAKGTLESDVAAIGQQPVASSAASLSRGKVNATFDATIKDTIAARATLTARGLVAKQDNVPLGDAELALTATVQPDGSSVINAPFTLTNSNRRSDVLLEGKLGRGEGGVTFDGRISSNQIFVDDLMPLAAVASASPAQSPQSTATARPGQPTTGPARQPAGQPAMQSRPTEAAAARDTQPFWTGAGGALQLDLKRIVYGRDYVISGIRGTAAITPRQLALQSLEGNFQENPFKLAASIDFDANQAQPYALGAMAHVTNLAVGELLRSINPNEKPQLESSVSIDAKINGNGATLQKLMLGAYGTFDLQGSKGVLRALANKSGRTLGGISALAGLAGAFIKNQNTAADVTAGADLAGKLAELPFDGFSMRVERGADLHLKIANLEFISPDTRLTGSGGITNQPGVPIQNQPLKVTLSLAGKDNMAYLMNRAGLLDGKQDEKGYYSMYTTFNLGGTPLSPNSSDLWRLVLEAGIKAAAGAGQTRPASPGP